MEPAKRVADEGIYLKEDRYEEPKEVFKFIANLIEKNRAEKNLSLLDVGCATGELLYYLRKRFPGFTFTGIDISKKMIEQASERMPEVSFQVASALEKTYFDKNKHDLVVSSGMLCIFDDVKTPLYHILNCLKPGGEAYLFNSFNEDPIDVIMRYREVDGKNSELQSGWNIFSKKTYENLLKEYPSKLEWGFHKFEMPFAIPKGKDPMRTWTFSTVDGKNQLVNGACQLIHASVLRVKKTAK